MVRPWHKVVIVVMLVALAGCSAPPRSTRLTIGDLNEATTRMTTSLAMSDLIRDRGPDSPRMVIVINKVENLTTDLIPVAEQWMMIARLRGAMPIQELSRNKNILFQIDPRRHRLLRDAGYEEDFGPTIEPTHVMTATFRSSRREVRDPAKGGHVVRVADLYALEYSITDLVTRQLQWTDRFEFQREAVGLRID